LNANIIWLELVASAITVATFTLAGILDWRWREIPPALWIAPIIFGIFVNVLHHFSHYGNCVDTLCEYVFQFQLFQLILSLILLCVIGILVFAIKILGGADFLAIASFTAVYPFNRLSILTYLKSNTLLQVFFFLPPILWILTMYSITMIFLILFNLLNNLKFYREIASLEVPLLSKILYVLFCKFMYMKEYRKKRFYYPVYVQSIVNRISFNIYEDDEEWKKKLSNVPDDSVIVVSWGIPMITFMSLAITVYIVLYIIILIILQ